jgi:hypothetical protein
MKMERVFRFFFAALVATIAAATFVSTGYSQVYLNEILADPARDWDGDGAVHYRDDEWVEIVNLGDSPVDISHYYLADGDGEPVWRYRFSGVLESGGVQVVFGSASVAWEQDYGYPAYGLSLNNTGDRVSLYAVAAGETLLVDTRIYGGDAARDDRSTGRDAQSTSAWMIFDAFNPCEGSCDPPGNGCVPTPGQANACITATRSESWGSIKNRYGS